jgi:hypothetical protein
MKYYVTFRVPEVGFNTQSLPTYAMTFFNENISSHACEDWLCQQEILNKDLHNLVLGWVLEKIQPSKFHHLIVQIEIQDSSGYRVHYKCQTN